MALHRQRLLLNPRHPSPTCVQPATFLQQRNPDKPGGREHCSTLFKSTGNLLRRAWRRFNLHLELRRPKMGLMMKKILFLLLLIPALSRAANPSFYDTTNLIASFGFGTNYQKVVASTNIQFNVTNYFTTNIVGTVTNISTNYVMFISGAAGGGGGSSTNGLATTNFVLTCVSATNTVNLITTTNLVNTSLVTTTNFVNNSLVTNNVALLTTVTNLVNAGPTNAGVNAAYVNAQISLTNYANLVITTGLVNSAISTASNNTMAQIQGALTTNNPAVLGVMTTYVNNAGSGNFTGYRTGMFTNVSGNSTATTTNITFSSPLPSANYTVLCTMVSTVSGSANALCFATAQTTNGFTANIFSAYASAYGFSYLAILSK